MERYICIHGHFYQPPRENPWLEAVELQDETAPYHDWNERITAECYAPNSASRILDSQDRIVGIVNNYASISFNFGPTLLAWLETQAPEVYRAILAADRESLERFSGHGSALAQAYNHTILPLANRRDKYTQVLWGLRDFQHRFRRMPEGLWLPEAAVDLESLDIMAEMGIRFTILAPHQAHRIRQIGDTEWQEATNSGIDPTTAYLLRLPSGREIALFFYNGPVSRAVAFEKLLASGEQFAKRLLAAFSDSRPRPQLVHIATDGETYGHHHRFGDMALAYALHHIEASGLARLTNYGEFLMKHPPTREVEIHENTSWSCAHGVERWQADCGCNTGANPQWSQAWRLPLREALDWLRDALAPHYEEMGSQLLRDPWAARNDYVSVVLDRSPERVERFLRQHTTHPLSEAERVTVLKLLEMQRHAMLMFTSCGWFFDDLFRTEVVQVIRYAGRAIQLFPELFGQDVEPGFLQVLEQAKSNVAEHGNGRQMYEKYVKPAAFGLREVAAHYAAISLFQSYPQQAKVYCYTVSKEDYRAFEAGKAKLAVGRVRVISAITEESAALSFGVLHMGDHNLMAGARPFQGEEAYQTVVHEISQAASRWDAAEVIRLLDRHFYGLTYSLKSLSRDEQRKVLEKVLHSTIEEAEGVYRQLYRHHAPLMRFLAGLGVPLPRAFRTAAEFVINSELRRTFHPETPDLQRARVLLQEVATWHVELDAPGLGYALGRAIERMALRFQAQPTEVPLLQRLEEAASLVRLMPFPVDMWRTQNIYYELLQSLHPRVRDAAQEGDQTARAWLEHFKALGELLRVRVE